MGSGEKNLNTYLKDYFLSFVWFKHLFIRYNVYLFYIHYNKQVQMTSQFCRNFQILHFMKEL